MTPALVRTLDLVRNRIETTGYAPTLDEIADATGVSKSRVHARIADLVSFGKLRKTSNRTRGIELAGVPDIRAIGSDALRAELARRGETLGALAKPERRAFARGDVACRVDSCGVAVERGHVMCRTHWFAVPLDLRNRLMRAYSIARRSRTGRDAGRYSDLLTEAADIAEGGRR